MPIRMTCDTDGSWNSNLFTITDGVERVMVSVHKDDDDPMQGETVSMPRKEFLELCQAYTRLTPPTD